jgi:hypothetical protein
VFTNKNKSGLPYFEMPTSAFNWEQFERYYLPEAIKINQDKKIKPQNI